MASLTHNAAIASKFAADAMAHMAALGLPPTPDNFELWYQHAAGLNRELCTALDGILQRGETPSDTDMDSIRRRFSAADRLTGTMSELGGRMEAELEQVITAMVDAGRDSNTYGEALSCAKDRLEGNVSGPALPQVLEGLLAATAQMQARTKSLEDQLLHSSQEITHLKDSLKVVHRQTLTDQLTGLANRRAFDEALENAVQAGTQNGQPTSLIISDIDHFKRINDTFGHTAGDQILRLTAHCIQDTVRDEDIAARYGGEEFAIVLPGAPHELALSLAETMRKSIENKRVIKRSSGEPLGTVTMSFGVALFGPDDTATSLLERADRCLYAAKNGGRNRVVSETAMDTQTETGQAAPAPEPAQPQAPEPQPAQSPATDPQPAQEVRRARA